MTITQKQWGRMEATEKLTAYHNLVQAYKQKIRSELTEYSEHSALIAEYREATGVDDTVHLETALAWKAKIMANAELEKIS